METTINNEFCSTFPKVEKKSSYTPSVKKAIDKLKDTNINIIEKIPNFSYDFLNISSITNNGSGQVTVTITGGGGGGSDRGTGAGAGGLSSPGKAGGSGIVVIRYKFQ